MTMKTILPHILREATRLTTTGRLTKATAVLQRMLQGQGTTGSPQAGARRAPPTIDGTAEDVVSARAKPTSFPGTTAGSGVNPPTFDIPGQTVPSEMPEAMHGFLGKFGHGDFRLPKTGLPDMSSTQARVAVPTGAQYKSMTFTGHAGSRPYKLYIPSSYNADRPVPLVVMLHGCTQSPDDFAAGTRMNEAAEEQCFLVAYPGQTNAANRQKCWNWFNEADQQRDRGEPSLIAGITREITDTYAVDPRRVYVAGLSAGGAAAAIMGDTYPDLYTAIGVHSGLACGAAHDMPSAFAAMHGGGAVRPGKQRVAVPAIIFHGDRDSTVNPRNADAVVAQSAQATPLRVKIEEGQIPGGYRYKCIRHADADGRTLIEQWVVHGAGHAWFGGSPAGTYTDPRGPNATAEMVRFFLKHPGPATKQRG